MKDFAKEIEQLLVRAESIKESASLETRDLTIEETAKINGILDEVDLIEANMKLEERTKATQARLAAPTTTVIKPIPAMNTQVDDEFRSFGQWACAVRDASVPGGRVDPRLLEERAAGDPTGSVASPSHGGFLVHKKFRPEVLKVFGDYANLLGLTTKIPMDSLYVAYNFFDGFDESGETVFGGIQWKMGSELASKTATNPAYGEFELKLKELYGMSYQSDKLLKFSPVIIETLLKSGFEYGLVQKSEHELIEGTGANGPKGVLNLGALVSVPIETDQAAGTILTENIVKMYARGMNRKNMIWVMSPDCMPQIFTMTLAVGTGGVSMFIPGGSLPNQPADTLLGRPIIWSDACKTVGTKGDILFCDWSMYHLGVPAGDGISPEYNVSIHLKFDYNQTAFRWVLYWDGDCWMRTYFTPLNGGDDRSPFVSLDVRE